MTYTPVTPELTKYVEDRFAQDDEVLQDLREALVDHGMPSIQVSRSTGRVLQLLVALTGGHRVLEVGTLGGYSAIWMGRGLAPGGRLTTLELDPGHAEVARRFLERAGLTEKVEVVVGDARSLLPGMGPDGGFDLVFLDADKEGYATYASHAWRLLRPGGVLLADNVLWSGRVLEEPEDEATRAIQEFNDHLARGLNPATILPVGDGLAMAVKPA